MVTASSPSNSGRGKPGAFWLSSTRRVGNVDQLADYPGIHSYLRLGAKVQLEERWELEAGFSENIKHQQATTDFGIRIGLTRQF